MVRLRGVTQEQFVANNAQSIAEGTLRRTPGSARTGDVDDGEIVAKLKL